MKWYINVILTCRSQIMSEAEHLYKNMFIRLGISSSMKCFSIILPNFCLSNCFTTVVYMFLVLILCWL